MSICVVEIITRTEGNVSRFRAENAAITKEDGGFRICYTEEGDAVTLCAKEDSFQMERKGSVSLSMRFVLREFTSLSIKEGADGGEISLYTAEYSFIRKERGFHVRLSYDLLFSAERQHFYVTIRSEEK